MRHSGTRGMVRAMGDRISGDIRGGSLRNATSRASVGDSYPTPVSREPILEDMARLPDLRRASIERIVNWLPENMFSKIEGRIARALQLRGYAIVLNFRIGPYTWDIVHVEARLIIEFDSRPWVLAVVATPLPTRGPNDHGTTPPVKPRVL